MPKEVAAWLHDRDSKYPKAEFAVFRFEISQSQRMEHELHAKQYSVFYGSSGGEGMGQIVFYYLSSAWNIRVVGDFSVEERETILGIREEKELIPMGAHGFVRKRSAGEALRGDLENATVLMRSAHQHSGAVSVVIIRGPLGVGKTTVAKWVAEKMGGQYFSIDTALDAFGFAKTEGDYCVEDFIRTQERLLPHIQQALQMGYPVILDGNFYFTEQIAYWSQKVAVPVHLFTLIGSLEECIRRDRFRAWPYGEVATRAIYGLVMNKDIDPGIIIDTEKMIIMDIVQDILRRIG